MYSDLVIFRVCQKEKWLIPLCRGLQGGSYGRCLVVNGGLWWPEMVSEGLLSRCRGCRYRGCRRLFPRLSWWKSFWV